MCYLLLLIIIIIMISNFPRGALTNTSVKTKSLVVTCSCPHLHYLSQYSDVAHASTYSAKMHCERVSRYCADMSQESTVAC